MNFPFSVRIDKHQKLPEGLASATRAGRGTVLGQDTRVKVLPSSDPRGRRPYGNKSWREIQSPKGMVQSWRSKETSIRPDAVGGVVASATCGAKMDVRGWTEKD
jgi:hypothetical protein